jgi:hypothetical protein
MTGFTSTSSGRPCLDGIPHNARGSPLSKHYLLSELPDTVAYSTWSEPPGSRLVTVGICAGGWSRDAVRLEEPTGLADRAEMVQ